MLNFGCLNCAVLFGIFLEIISAAISQHVITILFWGHYHQNKTKIERQTNNWTFENGHFG